MCFCVIASSQYMALATTLFSSHAQDSVSVKLNSNYRKPQAMDSRIVLVSFKEGEYGLQSAYVSFLHCNGQMNGPAADLL